MKKIKHGGKRKGSGRPKKEPTKVIRIPVRLEQDVKAAIAKLLVFAILAAPGVASAMENSLIANAAYYNQVGDKLMAHTVPKNQKVYKDQNGDVVISNQPRLQDISPAAGKPVKFEVGEITKPSEGIYINIQDDLVFRNPPINETDILMASCRLGYLDNEKMTDAYRKAGKIKDKGVSVSGCTEMKKN